MEESDKRVEQSGQKPASNPDEVRRLKRDAGIVVTLCLSVLAVVAIYSDAPRPFIDRLNPFLAGVVAFAFAILFHAMWRFRKNCGDWPRR